MKKYKNSVENFQPTGSERKASNIVWVLWFQGEENAPLLVKRCIATIRVNLSADKQVILLDSDNYLQYASPPPEIISKWKSGVISNAHYSDIIRCILLTEHGGLWMDATHYCTQGLSKRIEELRLFFPKRDRSSSVRMGNYFMYAHSHSPLLELTLSLMIEYWKSHNVIVDYFMFHMLVEIARTRFRDEYDAIPYAPHSVNTILANELFDQFSAERLSYLNSLTPYHKLTWKMNMPEDINGTFFEYITRPSREA